MIWHSKQKMNNDSIIVGAAWKHQTLTIAEYNAFIARPDAVLRIVMKGGVVQAVLPLEIIPNCGCTCPDDHYVFHVALRAGDIEKWEFPAGIDIRLSVQGEGYYWLRKLAQKEGSVQR